MGVIHNYTGVVHRIRSKPYKNRLNKVKRTHIARTYEEAILSIENICEAMKDRDGFAGKYKDLVENVKQFLEESAYQLCDGFSVNFRYFSIHPHTIGAFASASEVYDPQKHPVKFKFRVRSPLRNLTQNNEADIRGMADANAYIDEFTDTCEELVNSQFIPGNLFNLTGSKIKIAGEDPGCGIFFVPTEDPSKAVKVERIAENSASEIIGVAPDTGYTRNKIEVRTQFDGSALYLKAPRIIVSDFVLEAA